MENLETVKIEILDKDYESIANEFKNHLAGNYNVEIKTDEEEGLYATGETVELVFVFGDFIYQAIASGIAYDIIKTGVEKTFLKMKSLFPKQTKRISLRHLVDNKTVEFELETNLDDNIIKDIIDKSFAQTDSLKKITSQQKFKSDDGKYILKFNSNTGEWEPIDFEELRLDFQKQQDELKNRFED